MSEVEKLKRRLVTGLKLNGFVIRSEYSTLIIDSLTNANIILNGENFEHYLKVLCEYLEKHTDPEKSIDKHNIEKAIEACILTGAGDYELKFSVIDAFNYPRCVYDITKKHYFIKAQGKPQVSPEAEKKTEMFVNRYRNVLQRSQRVFKLKNLELNEDRWFHLKTVDSLLTISHKTLERDFILGALYFGGNGKYFIEDPTGMIELNLKHAKYHIGFYIENMYVLVNGVYADKTLQVGTMMLPPVEEFIESKIMFTHLNYFGGTSQSLLRDSIKLDQIMQENQQQMMVFVSDLWLDEEIVFEKVEKLLQGFEELPPIAFVFIGNFISQRYGQESLFKILTKAFCRLANIIKKFDGICKQSHFVFVPGLDDPCMSQILPRIPLPKLISKEFQKIVPNAIFATNPCRIQYYTREIVIYKNDLLSKFMQDSLNKPTKYKLDEFIMRSILSQGHLSPFSINAQPVQWDCDFALHLYPLPNLVVVGDKCSSYGGKYKGCALINPGCFIESGFAFKTYIPASDTVEDCQL